MSDQNDYAYGYQDNRAGRAPRILPSPAYLDGWYAWEIYKVQKPYERRRLLPPDVVEETRKLKRERDAAIAALGEKGT